MCDRQPLIRAGVRLILEREGGFRVAEAEDHDVVYLAGRLKPDLIVMDLDLPVERGLAVIADLPRSKGRPAVPVLVLTMVDDDASVFAALRAGARGFLLKRGPPEELFAAINAVVAGGGAVAPPIAGRLLDRVAPYLPDCNSDREQAELLTPREQDVFRLVALGWSTLAIARALGISQATVRSHVHHVITKLGLEDRTQAVVYAYRSGFVSPLAGEVPANGALRKPMPGN